MKKMQKKIAGFLSVFGLAFLVGCSDTPTETPKTPATAPAAEEQAIKESGADSELPETDVLIEDSDELKRQEEAMEGGDVVEEEKVSGDGATGTFTADGPYTAPPGPENVKVSVTLADGVITAVEVTPTATNDVSKKMQNAFAGGIAAEVVGKRIEDADVTVVAGSSLTGAGFNKALDDIQAQL